MSPASIHGRGKSNGKKTPQERQRKATPREHCDKYAAERNGSTDIRDAKPIQQLSKAGKSR